MNIFDSSLVSRLIDLALEEDLAHGDVTSSILIPADARGTGRLIARSEMVMCGGGILEQIARRAGFGIAVKLFASDGTVAHDGDVIAVLDGGLRELLALERTALNFLQRLGGVATHTRNFVDAAAGLVVLDTRKTTPGWRVLEKYAVRVGGAKNHRASLGDMVLIKNNHIDAVEGDFSAMKERLVRDKPWYLPVEVEVRSLTELREALALEPDVVMLDNFADGQIRDAVQFLRSEMPSVQIEVSGGITADRLRKLAALGVQTVSAGALTTAARNVDISMRIS